MVNIQSSVVRISLILAIAVGAHLIALAIRWLGRRTLSSRLGSETKVQTVTGFVTSSLIFVIYFAAVGFILRELGISLSTYLASASVIGLAVSFGSQGLVQDVITGLTLVFSDLLDVGDMVEIGGQIGIVQAVHMRFTALVNFSGALVHIPNRSITNVISYPKGYVRAFLDVRLPADRRRWDALEAKVAQIAEAAHEQFPGILLLPPTMEPKRETSGGQAHLRVKFRIWPGQGAIIEQAVKSSIVQSLKILDDGYADWMVTVHYRAEPPGSEGDKRLPRPSAIGNR